MIGHWLTQHRLALTQVLVRLWRNPLSLLMMAAVIGVTLALPAMLYVILGSLQRFAGDLDTPPQISLFLAADASADTAKGLTQRLDQHPAVASYRFIARDEAWRELQQNSGLTDVASGLEQNPLPDAFVIHMENEDAAAMERLQQEMQQWPGVEHAQLDAAWLKRLNSLLQLGNQLALVIAALLGFALLVVTGNSIRLQFMTQRDEIELSRLIGATDRFIRRPFLYAGTLYGLAGGLAALLIVAATVWLFNQSIAELARSYAADFSLAMPGAEIAIALAGGSAVLGWIGSYWAASRSLASIGKN